jgi:hypothetical protein
MMLKLSFVRRTIVGIGLTLRSVPSGAQPADEPVRFDYRAPPNCPDAETFATRVRERTARARLGERHELARTFVVEVRVEEGGGATARLSFVDSRGSPVVRSVRGQTCDEVVSAIALITALAIEAGPIVAGEPTSVVAPPPRTSAPPPEPLATAGKKERALRRPEPEALAWLAGIQAGVTTWLGPSPNLGVGVFGEVGVYAGASARLTLLYSTSHELVALSDGAFRRADFTAFVARAEGCPYAAGLGGGFRFVPCLGFGLGLLEGQGDQETVHPSKEGRRFWAEVVPTLRFDWTVSDSLVFFAQGELGLPLVRRTFVFEGPPQPVWEIPAAGAGAAFGMAWRFE